MGACASKPKDLDTESVPAPLETPAAAVEPEPQTVAQEVKDGDEKKEEGLVEVSEAAPKTQKEEKPETVATL